MDRCASTKGASAKKPPHQDSYMTSDVQSKWNLLKIELGADDARKLSGSNFHGLCAPLSSCLANMTCVGAPATGMHCPVAALPQCQPMLRWMLLQTARLLLIDRPAELNGVQLYANHKKLKAHGST